MNKFYALYDSRKRILSVQEQDELLPIPPNSIEVDSTFSTVNPLYLNTNNIAVRQQGYSLNAIPIPSTILIEGVEYRCNSQPEFKFDVDGEYIIHVYPDDGSFQDMVFFYDTRTQSART